MNDMRCPCEAGRPEECLEHSQEAGGIDAVAMKQPESATAGEAGQPTCSHGVYAGAHCDKCEAYANELEEAETKKRAAGAAKTPAGPPFDIPMSPEEWKKCYGGTDPTGPVDQMIRRIELSAWNWMCRAQDAERALRAAQPSADAERLRGALRELLDAAQKIADHEDIIESLERSEGAVFDHLAFPRFVKALADYKALLATETHALEAKRPAST